MPIPDYASAYDFVIQKLQNNLSPELYYHSLQHTIGDVLPAAERLAEMEGVSETDSLLVKTAALYHDIGYIEAYERNETIAARIADETLPGFGYTAEQIEVIHGLIMATQVPQQPQNRLQQIICDADLNALGRDDFFITSHRLRLELMRYSGRYIPLSEWYRRQLGFLELHEYWTGSARTVYEPEKQRTMQELRGLLGIG